MQQRERVKPRGVTPYATTERGMKRVIDRTETTDNFIDGTFATLKREHIEETLPPAHSGFLEAWFGLVLLLSTGVVFGLIFKLLGFVPSPTPQQIQHTTYMVQPMPPLSPETEDFIPQTQVQHTVQRQRYQCQKGCRRRIKTIIYAHP